MALVQDDAGRELLALVAKLESHIAGPVLSYLSLFKPVKSDLSNDRSLKLLKELFDLHGNRKLIAEACAQTVNSIHAKRRTDQDTRPLKNHNYLKQIVTSIESQFAGHEQAQNTTRPVFNLSEMSADQLAEEQRRHFKKLK